MRQIEETILKQVIKKRTSNSHKGDYGRLLLIGGNANFGGAIIMAAEGAINSGAGLTCVATHSLNLTALHARSPEAMFMDWRDSQLPSLISKMDAIVCGPGLGTDDFAKQLLIKLRDHCTTAQTIVLDASALDLIADNNTLLPQNAKTLILTPHQMEWQRLSHLRIPYQTDAANQNALNTLIPMKNSILVLKSNQTHVYDQQNHSYKNIIGNPGMATGGTGDTLAGIIGGFVSQFSQPFESVLAAVYLHSLAGDLLHESNYVVRPTQISQLVSQLMKKYQN